VTAIGWRQCKNRRAREPLCPEVKQRKRAQRGWVALSVYARDLCCSDEIFCVQIQVDLSVITTGHRQIEDECTVAHRNIPYRRRLRLRCDRAALGQGERSLKLVAPITALAAIDANVACTCACCMCEDRSVERHAHLPRRAYRKNDLTLIT
jgi:hypothetical protein